VFSSRDAGVKQPIVMAASPTSATLRLYDPIDADGGEWGVSAKEFAASLDSLDKGVREIQLRINSPGGDVFEGLAILNALRDHPAKVVAVVDGVAASAASFVAMAADEVLMSRNTEMMIHDASGLALGNANVMHDMAGRLDKISDNIADVYASRAGGTVEEWRKAMLAETWYSADEAVEAGLADRVREPAPGDPEPTEAKARYNLAVFAHAGREKAPAPFMPTRTPVADVAAGQHNPGEEPAVAFSDEQLTTLRQKLGTADDADEATILAALDEALSERAEPPAAPSPTQPTDSAPTDAQPTGQTSAATPGTMVIDSSAWEEREARIKRLEAQDAKRRREERDAVIGQAVRDGKFPHARVEHWARLWDADPEGTRTVIAGLARNVVPVNEIGHGGDDAEFDAEFAHLFPPVPSVKGA
jgi:ATP-dependent protease ClpP protease subunit